MPRAIAVMLALGAQHEAVQPARLANRIHSLQASGEHFVDVGLVANIKEQLVLGSIEYRVQGQGQLDHSQIRPQVAAGLGERLNQENANLLGQLRHLRKVQALQIGGRVDALQQCSHGLPSPGDGPGPQTKSPRDRHGAANGLSIQHNTPKPGPKPYFRPTPDPERRGLKQIPPSIPIWRLAGRLQGWTRSGPAGLACASKSPGCTIAM